MDEEDNVSSLKLTTETLKVLQEAGALDHTIDKSVTMEKGTEEGASNAPANQISIGTPVGTCYMDEDGNYYIKNGDDIVPIAPLKPISKINLDKKPTKSLKSGVKTRKAKQLKNVEKKIKKLPVTKIASKNDRQIVNIVKFSKKEDVFEKTPSVSKKITNATPVKTVELKQKSKLLPTPVIDPITVPEPEPLVVTVPKTVVKSSPLISPIKEQINQIYKINFDDIICDDPDDIASEIHEEIQIENLVIHQTEQNQNEQENQKPTKSPIKKNKGKIFVVAGDSNTANSSSDENAKTPSTENNQSTNEFKCNFCNYTTSKRYILLRHLRRHSDERPLKCSVCDKGFKTNSSLMNHVNIHLGNKPHGCSMCDKSFTTSGELLRHQRYRHTGEKPHKCTDCSYSSVELSKLRRHMRSHTGERPYQCPHCTYASPDTFKLKRHLRTHTGERPYTCEICHTSFTQSNSLKAHKLIHSVAEKPVFQCHLCPTTCGRKTDLRSHIEKLHNPDHPMTCKRCGQVLPDRYAYKIHSKTHDGEKCFRCKVCPYGSTSMRHLESHMLIHTDEKPFVCNECNMAFRQLQLLKRHMNLYHNINYVPPVPREKAHSCPDCFRAFTHKGNLMRHMETHDPNSNITQAKQELKLGRMTRIKPNQNLSTAKVTTISPNAVNKNYNKTIKTRRQQENAGIADLNEMKNRITIVTNDEVIGTLEHISADSIEFVDVQSPTSDKNKWQNVISKGVNGKVNLNGNRNGNKTIKRATTIPKISNVSVNEEISGKKFVKVHVSDGEEFMVLEVLQCDDGDEDDTQYQAANVINVPLNNNKQLEAEINTAFGYEEDNREPIEFIDVIDVETPMHDYNL